MMAHPTDSITYNQYNLELRTPEQELAEQLLLKHKHFILGFEPGKGKSYPVIHATLEVQRIKNRPINVLVMSDATAIKDMWKVEIMTQRIMPKETYFVTDRTAIGAVKEALVKKVWDVIIIDECQSLRSGITRAKSQYAKLVHSLTKRAEYVFGMTGTLSGNNDIEPWCVLHNLNVAEMGKIDTNSFKKNCCVLELQYGPFGNFLKPTKLNERGSALLAAAYEKGVMFWDYDDKDDMPPLTIKFVEFPVVATLEYKNALEGILKLGAYENTIMKATAIQKAQQALNGFIYYDDAGIRHTYQVGDYYNPKLKYIVRRCVTQPTIVGYRFQEDGESLKYVLTEAGITHTSNIQEFRDSSKYQVLVLQCSRGKSVNLHKATLILYYTADFSFISYKQFIHRAWRRNQTQPCEVEFLINDPGDKHKVEFHIWESMRRKQSIHDTLMAIKQKGM
jgi:hypothetical protein